MSKLWYNLPAKEWEEALPLGNGRLGAMVYGNIENEIIQVNEESMWYGAPCNRNNIDAKNALPKIREYLFSGEIHKAERLMKYALSGTPDSMHPYQTLGEILIHFYNQTNNSNYYRELDLNTAIYKQTYKANTTSYSRQIFISKPADAMIIYLKSEGSSLMNFDVILRREKFFDGIKKSGDNGIYLYGNLGKGGFDFGMTITCQIKSGNLNIIGEHIVITDASEAILYFTANTTYQLGENADIEQHNLNKLKALEKENYSLIVKNHLDDYQSLFNRVDFNLGDVSNYDTIPTDERVKKAASKKADIGLNKLYFDYGRYLLISCSRKGGLPATLQGIWNKDMLPPWDSKYTININTEMNYWLAENCNLSECHEPLFSIIKKMIPNGRQTAQDMYGCRGFVCHHNTDIYGDTAVQDMWNPGSYWVMGAAWLCTHLWTHYEYALDKEFLKEYFPIMREAALFFVDYLVEHNGYMVTCPSVSPENTFILPNGQTGANIYGVTMDNQILRDLFTQCIEAASILDVDDELNKQLIELNKKLIPTQIGANGNILEWPIDYEEVEPGHRHISHLYGLFPSDQISVDKTPELANAAKITLERRLSQGGGHTGWSRAWIINHYAKLWDGEKAYDNLKMLYGNSTYNNLFDKHPPFQIDGNFGATAAIANMIVQSDMNRIVLLPAIPRAWKTGSIKGLKIKGNGEINISWKNGKLTNCTITFKYDCEKEIKYKNNSKNINFIANEAVELKTNFFNVLK